MAFTGSAMATSFKMEVMKATHNLSAAGGDVFKLALFTNAATLDASTATYSTSNEVIGTNYVAGGNTLTNIDPLSSGVIGYAQFGNVTFVNVTITARGAVIYNSSKSNKVVCVLDFGADKSATAGDFVITMPSFNNSSALLRFT